MYDNKGGHESLWVAWSERLISDFASNFAGSMTMPETETMQPEEPAPTAITSDESTDWQQRTRKLCGIVGFVSGALGILAGIALTPAIGIDSRLPGGAGHAGASQVPVQITSRPRSKGDGMVIQFRNTSAQALRSVVIQMSAPGRDNHILSLDSLDPGGLAEIGEDDGWRVAAGQKLAITAAGYEPVVVTIN